jgi:CRP-like cAMP-binding protein
MTSINLFRQARDVVRFRAGETICAQGAPADHLYVIVAGEVEVRGDAGLIAVLGCGEVLGELAFLDGGPRTASAIALGDCTLAPIDRRRFEFLVQHTPHFVEQLIAVLAGRK